MQLNMVFVYGAGQTYINMFNKARSNNIDWNPPDFIYNVMKKINDILQINSDEIYDSVTVVKEVVRNTFTIVSQVITTKRLIHENIR